VKRTDNDDRLDRHCDHTQQFIDTTEHIGKVILDSRSGQDVLEVIATGLTNSLAFLSHCDYQTKITNITDELLRRKSRKPRKRSKNEKNQQF